MKLKNTFYQERFIIKHIDGSVETAVFHYAIDIEFNTVLFIKLPSLTTALRVVNSIKY